MIVFKIVFINLTLGLAAGRLARKALRRCNPTLGSQTRLYPAPIVHSRQHVRNVTDEEHARIKTTMGHQGSRKNADDRLLVPIPSVDVTKKPAVRVNDGYHGRMMKRVFAFLIGAILPSTVLAQQSDIGDEKKAWSRSAKEIAFQNDSQWEDNRWQLTDIGPFLAASVETPAGVTLKGIAIRVGEQGDAAVCFDTAMMRFSAAWSGGFLEFEPRRFGIIRFPKAAGETYFVTPNVAGWANRGRFDPKPAEYTRPALEEGYTESGKSIVHLRKDWAHYRGLYTNGDRVVLSYTVGSTNVLESPWFVRADGHEAFIRSLEIGPSTSSLSMWVADPGSRVTVIGNSGSRLGEHSDGSPILVIDPHLNTVRLKLLITAKETDGNAIGSLREAAGNVENLSQMIKHDRGRWPRALSTVGSTTETGGPYVIDTLTLPFENPYKALLFTSGHDFFSDGSAAVCTVHGDVWVVTGIDRQLKQLRWRRFATGLFQPLGLKIVDDCVHVIGRDQITRLHDRNDDGEADFYENFNNDLIIAPRNHDFVTCLDTDPEGNFYFIHAETGVMRVSADGSEIRSVADGFRNPNGMTVGPDGTITAAPQQGQWTPESSIIVVREGGYYGYGGPRVTADRPTGWDAPMCFIPREMDNSGGAQVWVKDDRWGPLHGKMLHLSYGQCRLLLALSEQVGGVHQGGTIKFPTIPADFEAGIMRGRFNPLDGQLYVSGLRGWQTRAVRDGCFQRVRYTGGPLHLPIDVKTYTNGIKLSFTEPLDREVAENCDNYFVEQWNYRWTQEYGSPEFSVENPSQQGRDEVPVVSATWMDDGYAVFLEMPGRRPVMQLSISWLLRSAEGDQFRGRYAHTINANPNQTVPEAQIVRRQRVRRISEAVERRLQPGLKFHFESLGTDQSDVRISRLATLEQPISDAPTPFLSPGPFSLEVSGTLHTSLSGFYNFKIEGRGAPRMWLNDRLTLSHEAHLATTEAILLQKGHNPIRIQYTSPNQGSARLRLWWKGYNFGWEPVPSSVFFHDSGSGDLADPRRRRLGRQLFADHKCDACHRTEIDEPSMFELSLAAPDLSAAGDRFRATWLQQWLVSPKKLRPDTGMPSVLGDGEAAIRDAADITAFLLSRRGATSANSTIGNATSDSPHAHGAMLYERLGCITCHHLKAPDTLDPFGRISLHDANAKFRSHALAAFLENPIAYHAASKMPDFRLSANESSQLAAYLRSESKGRFTESGPSGNAERGQRLFVQVGCQQCHSIGEAFATREPHLEWRQAVANSGCLARTRSTLDEHVPAFSFSEDQLHALRGFLQHDVYSLGCVSAVETSKRIVQRLRCASCHDRDGDRSPRMMIMAEEGSGEIPEVLPELTWSGEKLRSAWTERLLSGGLDYKSRPWLAARMPAFPAYANVLAHGLAAEHAIGQADRFQSSFDPNMAIIGERLSRQSALDCRQCHAIGDQLPRGDKSTRISHGINFAYIGERLRRGFYDRYMLNPPRYDRNTKMIRISEDGKTTKLKGYFDADARQQFGAVWEYIQSVSPHPRR